MEPAFAIWLTGPPAAGKSTLAAALSAALSARGVKAAVLESDALRRVLTPRPRYDEEERDQFYRAMVFIGRLLVEHGAPVIFDATAHRRAYRDRARREIPRFVEVYVECPLATCMSRDPKGIYRAGQDGGPTSIPGLQVAYEPPERPDMRVRGDQEEPAEAAARVLAVLTERGYLPPATNETGGGGPATLLYS
jgi:adenylylsulfate kinase